MDVAFFGNKIYCAEIYSWGLRNPIRMALNTNQSDTNKVLFSISDVGADRFEELSWAGTEFKAKNYGWPEREGPCAFDTTELHCPVPSTDSNLVDPFYYYAHTQNGGSVGASAFSDGTWPGEYKYLFMDAELQTIYNLVEDSDAECRSCSPPTSAFVNTPFYEPTVERVIDMFFGPYRESQALYVIKYGDYSSIHRIRYEGLPPVAVIEVGNQQQHDINSLPVSKPFLVGERVWFDASRSIDPEGGKLTFQWDFGDQSGSSNSSNAFHVYDEPGEYTVFLVVTNSRNKGHVTSTTVVVGNSPTITMLTPMEGDFFTLGEMLRLNAEAYDYQGNLIPDDQMWWSVRQYHWDGFEFLLDETSGNNFELNPVPEPEHFMSAEIILLRVVLFVTDDRGLITEVETNIYPNIVPVNIVTEPEGLQINVVGNELTAPTHIYSLANFNLPVQITSEQPPYKFQKWSDGSKSASRAIFIPSQERDLANTTQANDTTMTIEAIFCLVDNASCSNATTTCCSGYCDVSGFCRNENPTSAIIPPMDDEVEIPTPSQTDVNSRPNSSGKESVGKPVVPNLSNIIGDDVKLSLARGRNVFDEQSQEENVQDAYNVNPLSKWFLGISMTFLLIALIYLGFKYFRLKRKLATESNNTSSPEFQDKPMSPKTVEATSGGLEDVSNCVIVSDEVKVSSISSTSNTSLSSMSTSFQKSGTIWERIAEETERRAKLRAKYSSAGTAVTAVTLPKTPEAMETGESPSHDDPSRTLATNIDETLVRLDDLLAKCFDRKPARSRRKEERNDDSFESNDDTMEKGTSKANDIESGALNNDKIESAENTDFVPVWLSSNKKSRPGSPVQEKKDESFVEATFSMSSLYSSGSLQDVSNESHALHLPEVSHTSNQSLLIFQDNDLSMSNKESSANESDINDALMESGMVGDGGMSAANNLSTFNDRYLLEVNGNGGDLTEDEESSNQSNDFLIGSGGDLAEDGDMPATNDLSTLSEKYLEEVIGNGGDVAKAEESSNRSNHLLIGNGGDVAGDGDISAPYDLSAFSEGYLREVIGNGDDVAKVEESSDRNNHVVLIGNGGDVADNENLSAANDVSAFSEGYLREVIGNGGDLAFDGDKSAANDVSAFSEGYSPEVIKDGDVSAANDLSTFSEGYLREVVGNGGDLSEDADMSAANDLSTFSEGYLREVIGNGGDLSEGADMSAANDLSTFSEGYLQEVAGNEGDSAKDEEISNQSKHLLIKNGGDLDEKEETTNRDNYLTDYEKDYRLIGNGRDLDEDGENTNKISSDKTSSLIENGDGPTGETKSAKGVNVISFDEEEVVSDRESFTERSLRSSEERRQLIKRVDDLYEFLGGDYQFN